MSVFYVIRHAKAGDRDAWTGDDRIRPLTKKGRDQAERLVGVLESFPLTAVLSSPYVRCVQTVEPLAHARGLAVKPSPALAEGHGLAGALSLMADRRLNHAALCTHGDIVWEIIEELSRLGLIAAGEGGYAKGSTWRLELDGDRLTGARYIPAT